MALNLQTYMESLPENSRVRLHEQMKHSVSWFIPEGQHLANPYEIENLLDVLMGRERYVVDTNSHWRMESKKPENRNKAFILGRTVIEEEENLKSVFSVDAPGNNLFAFELVTEWENL